MSGQYSGEVCVADDGLINPANFPCKSATLDTTLITGSGDKVAAIGTQVLTTAQAAETSWKGLQSPGVFETPDSGVVYSLMQPAVNGATDMNGVTGRLSTALHTYAAELEAIKPDLADLEERATAFRERAQKGYEVSNWEARGWLSNFETGIDGNPVPKADANEKTTISWQEHGPAVEKNKSLIHEHNAILERISTAATTCANAIQRELKMVCVAPAQAITAEMLESSDLSVWGSATEEKRNCTESVGHGLGNFWHNTWTGAASLIGRDATTGEWSWETAGKTWWGVGDFALSTVIVLVPGVNIAAAVMSGQDNELGHFMNDRYNTAVSSWGGLIGWDQQAHLAGENGWHKYEEDGVAALTESVANVGTFFIPVAGAASGGTKAVLAGTRVGSFVVKAGTHLAEFVIPAGSYLVKGTVKVIDLGVDLTKGGWKGLIDSLTPGPIRPNALPGITGVATEAQVPLPSKTPVSSSLGLEGAPTAHTGGQGPGVSGSGAPHGGLDGSPLPERPGGEPQLGNQWGDQQPGGQHPVDPTPAEPHPTDPKPTDSHPGTDGTGDHTGSGLDSDTRDRIIEMEKGSRPLPETYLSPEYIREHLQKFDGGATRFMTESNLSKYGIGQRDGTAFVMPTAEVDALLRSVNGDMRKFEAALGLPDGFFDTNKVVRVDIANPAGEGLRMPSGNEAGANSQWLPGGKLPTGISEAVIDIPGDGSLKYSVQPMGARVDVEVQSVHNAADAHASAVGSEGSAQLRRENSSVIVIESGSGGNSGSGHHGSGDGSADFAGHEGGSEGEYVNREGVQSDADRFEDVSAQDPITPEQRASIERYEHLIDSGRFDDRPYLKRMFEGSLFNVENHHRFKLNEISVNREGGGYYRVDSLNPGGETVSRKSTQLSQIDLKSARIYLDEFEKKYQIGRSDITIADTPGNRQKLLDAGYNPDRFIGRPLDGRQILEVPPQQAPPPIEFLRDAAARDPEIFVRDNAGTEWSVEGEIIIETRIDGTIIEHSPGDEA